MKQLFKKDRGLSFVTGGEGSWSSTSSLANILKQFNPGLVGLFCFQLNLSIIIWIE